MAIPRFTLPDPSRAEAPALPPELLTHILKLAQAGESPTEQLKIRLTFEKVSKAWFLCDFRWRVIALPNFRALESLLDCFLIVGKAAGSGVVTRTGGASAAAVVEQLAERVKTLHLTTTKADALGKTDKITRLLSLAKNVDSVELVVSGGGLGSGQDCLDGPITAALAALKKVKHFKLTGPDYNRKGAPISRMTDALITLAPHWKELESIAINNCMAAIFFGKDELLTPSPAFKSFALSGCGSQAKRFPALVAGLPPSTRELVIDDKRTFTAFQRIGPLSDVALKVARALKVVRLTAGQDLPTSVPIIGCDRGLMDEFVTSLDDVTDLALNPCAIDNLADLAKPKKLTTLEIVYGLNFPDARVEPIEFLDLVNNSTSLKRVAAQINYFNAWEFEQLTQVEDAAYAKGINFTWVDADGEDAFDHCDYDEFGDELDYCPHCGDVH